MLIFKKNCLASVYFTVVYGYASAAYIGVGGNMLSVGAVSVRDSVCLCVILSLNCRDEIVTAMRCKI